MFSSEGSCSDISVPRVYRFPFPAQMYLYGDADNTTIGTATFTLVHQGYRFLASCID